jgi:hypothetical protein
MKRLCVFYYKAPEWLGKPVKWIVCKECQKKLKSPVILRVWRNGIRRGLKTPGPKGRVGSTPT